jgi:hypothetical protein
MGIPSHRVKTLEGTRMTYVINEPCIVRRSGSIQWRGYIERNAAYYSKWHGTEVVPGDDRGVRRESWPR